MKLKLSPFKRLARESWEIAMASVESSELRQRLRERWGEYQVLHSEEAAVEERLSPLQWLYLAEEGSESVHRLCLSQNSMRRFAKGQSKEEDAKEALIHRRDWVTEMWSRTGHCHSLYHNFIIRRLPTKFIRNGMLSRCRGIWEDEDSLRLVLDLGILTRYKSQGARTRILQREAMEAVRANGLAIAPGRLSLAGLRLDTPKDQLVYSTSPLLGAFSLARSEYFPARLTSLAPHQLYPDSPHAFVSPIGREELAEVDPEVVYVILPENGVHGFTDSKCRDYHLSAMKAHKDWPSYRLPLWRRGGIMADSRWMRPLRRSTAHRSFGADVKVGALLDALRFRSWEAALQRNLTDEIIEATLLAQFRDKIREMKESANEEERSSATEQISSQLSSG